MHLSSARENRQILHAAQFFWRNIQISGQDNLFRWRSLIRSWWTFCDGVRLDTLTKNSINVKAIAVFVLMMGCIFALDTDTKVSWFEHTLATSLTFPPSWIADESTCLLSITADQKK